MKTIKKYVPDSEVIKTEMVLPNDTNTLNNLMGGKLMHWMDVVAAISAQRHSNSIVVTASVDNISFKNPIAQGNVVTLKAQVTRAFSTSMEVFIEVFAEDIPANLKYATHKAFFTFVAVDDQGRPVPVPSLEPVSQTEKELYAGALRRRQLRLILANRMDPKDATELKSLFDLEGVSQKQ
ncbi:acyl-CoA thioesterase [Cyclobacterium xiamenense]|uniref:acyl-CoA thioesterase n=1 Tax=Cyclobacterium xiamenense TaxID=1297121 RepID=UPI0012B8B4EB|nr:acyl-CoA thioesterase [Cyclobacterium xiamenense]